MTIKFGANLLSHSIQRNLNTTTNELGKVSERLSTGLRINRASDDAAGLAIAKSLNVDSRVFTQALRNLNDGSSFVNIADAALNELTNVVIRIEELAEQSANGTFSDTQRVSLQKEVTALQDELNRIIKSTDFNGRSILTGTDSKTVLQGGYGLDNMLGVQVGAEQFEGGIEGFAGGTTRVSTSSSEEETNNTSYNARISANSRYVVFISRATNLISGDTNGFRDIFRKDIITGEVLRVSTSSNGSQTSGNSFNPQISDDGRYVVFESDASNLVSGDTNGFRDIFRKDVITGEVLRVSSSINGSQSNSNAFNAQISADGRYVAFESTASNLVEGDNNAARDIFRKDMLTGDVLRVTTSSNGSQSNNNAFNAQISADGRYVVFESDASNLVAGDNNAARDIFRKDMLTGEVLRVNTSSNGSQSNNNSNNAQISADGRYVVFSSDASNLVAGDTNAATDIFRKDMQTGEVLRVSTNGNGGEGNGVSFNSSISADGRYVLFGSSSTNLVENDRNNKSDIFRKDILTGEVLRVNTSSSGEEDNGSNNGHISSDGRHIVFESISSNLVSGDSNGASDIFLRDLSRMGIQEMSGMVVSNQVSARYTLDLAKKYREEITSYRSKLGATSSRISTFLSTLDSTRLNYQSASSRISDADIATDAASNVNAKIKQQAAASLLAQANQDPLIGLKLLENI
jgi:flagellin-like hook-associated protein FlgL